VKITTVNVVMFSVGAILVYSGIKGYDPRDVIQWGLGGKKPQTMKAKNDAAEKPKVNPKDHPGDMPDTYPPGTQNGGEPTVPAVYPA
jgi:hypothetical protein